MARDTGPDCRRCRREKMKLFLKGSKCESPKCPIEIRPYPPGEHGRGRTKDSEYLFQLREKQKARRVYGVLEKQFRGYYAEANRKTGRPARSCCRSSSRGWTTWSTGPASRRPATPPASWSGTGTCSSTARRSTSRLPGQPERHRRGAREVLRADPVRGRPRRRPAPGRCRRGWRSSPPGCGSSCTPSRPGRSSTRRSRSSSSSSSTPSRHSSRRFRQPEGFPGPRGKCLRRHIAGGREGTPHHADHSAPHPAEEQISEYRSRFIIEPLEPGFGYTLGNSLRRTLLSSIPGAAVTSLRIDGVLHEFTTVPGVKEDVTDLILNLKELVVSSDADEPVDDVPAQAGPR